MKQPLVSVIVPNYNYARALHLCLDSLRAQTYPHLEIIVVDDCSTDDSVAVAEAHGARVTRTPYNGGRRRRATSARRSRRERSCSSSTRTWPPGPTRWPTLSNCSAPTRQSGLSAATTTRCR
ncbi:hypothetical protein GCM10029963_23440 [Micromonospora andamanensis]